MDWLSPLKESMPKMQSLLAKQVAAQQEKKLADSLETTRKPTLTPMEARVLVPFSSLSPKVQTYLRSQTITFVSIFVTGCS